MRFRQQGCFPKTNPLIFKPVCLLTIVTAVCLWNTRLANRAVAGEDAFSKITPISWTSGGKSAAEMLLFDFETVEQSGESWVPSFMLRSEPNHSHAHVDVPEPLLFDLVRPLGARKGELEFNTLAIFPWAASNTNLEDDPFGSGSTTFDKQGIEWAPEIELAIADNFAIEFELPFESSTLEEYKLGLQWTAGTAFDNRYIHGFQVLIQPTPAWEKWNSTFLYLAGMRFDETWSALLMVGARMDLEGPANSESFERLINASIFADLNESARVGLETNYASKLDGTAEFILVPQVHYQFTDHFQVQSGLGLGAFSEGYEQSFILRVIFSN